MSRPEKTTARLRYESGAFGAALDAFVAENLKLADGQEVSLREEDGRIVIEAIRPKILDPVTDPAARVERAKRFAEALDEVAADHRELFALLAR